MMKVKETAMEATKMPETITKLASLTRADNGNWRIEVDHAHEIKEELKALGYIYEADYKRWVLDLGPETPAPTVAVRTWAALRELGCHAAENLDRLERAWQTPQVQELLA